MKDRDMIGSPVSSSTVFSPEAGKVQPDRPPQILFGLEALDSALSDLFSLHTQLHGRLENILMPAESTEGKGTVPVGDNNLCPMAKTLAEMRDRVNCHTKFITSILDRLEV